MIDFKNITHVVNIFYLGGIAGMEGPILNILKKLIKNKGLNFSSFLYLFRNNE